MDYLMIFFIVVLVVAVAFLIWLYTKSGKKWLASL